MQIIHQAPLAALGLGAAFTVIWGVADPVAALAEVRVIEADGYYIMGDGPEENAAVAKERARADARRAASEQAGLYVAGMTEVKKGKLTRDEIRTISAAVLEVKEDNVTPEVLGGTVIQYHCHMKAVVDTGSITDQLRQDRAELDAAVQRNMELEKEVDRVNAEMAALKEQYGKAGSETARQEIQHEVNRNEVDFESNQLVVKALEQRRAGDKEGALNSLKKSLELNPRNIAAYNTIGGIYIELREYAKAVEIFQKLQSVAPANTASYVNMGVAYAEMGEYHKAIPYYEKALSMDWSDYSRDSKATTYANYGMVYLQMDEREKAYNMFRRALDISPENADALGGLGRYYYEIDEFQTAVKYLEKAVAIDQSDPKDYVNLGLSYSKLKEYAKGKEAHRKALKIDSKCVEAYVGLGSIYRDEKQFEKAIDCYNRAVEFAKDKDSLYHAYMSRCVCYCLMKSWDKALRDAEKALEIDENGEESAKLHELRDRLRTLV